MYFRVSPGRPRRRANKRADAVITAVWVSVGQQTAGTTGSPRTETGGEPQRNQPLLDLTHPAAQTVGCLELCGNVPAGYTHPRLRKAKMQGDLGITFLQTPEEQWGCAEKRCFRCSVPCFCYSWSRSRGVLPKKTTTKTSDTIK